MHNWKYLLTSQLARGTWFLSLAHAQAGMSDADRLLNPTLSSFAEDARVLAERNPFQTIAATSDDSNISDSYDSLPEGSIAVIRVTGTLLKYGTWCSYGTEEIAQQMIAAANHRNIGGLLFEGDSGGGGVNAVDPMRKGFQAFKALGKPTLSLMDTCFSAMYYGISQSDIIMASNDISSGFGSIGVMLSYMDMTKYLTDLGIERVSLYPDESSEKNLAFELAMKKDYDMIRNEELAPLARKFQNTVIADRPKLMHLEDPKIIKGKTYSAEESVANGLADAIGDRSAALDMLFDLIKIKQYLNS